MSFMLSLNAERKPIYAFYQLLSINYCHCLLPFIHPPHPLSCLSPHPHPHPLSPHPHPEFHNHLHATSLPLPSASNRANSHPCCGPSRFFWHLFPSTRPVYLSFTRLFPRHDMISAVYCTRCSSMVIVHPIISMALASTLFAVAFQE